MTIKGSLKVDILNVKAILTRHFLSCRKLAINLRFSGGGKGIKM